MLSAYSFEAAPVPPNYRCYFYLLHDKYLTTEQQLGNGLQQLVGVFARDLGDAGIVVHSCALDLERTNLEMHLKWERRPDAAATIDDNLPGLLMLDRPFAQFNPDDHTWILFHFWQDAERTRSCGSLCLQRHP